MDDPLKTNRLAKLSFASGMIALVCGGLVFAAYNFLEPARGLISFVDGLLLPARNLSVILALAAGILSLGEIRKKAGTEKGKGLAWAGILIGAGWILFGLMVGLAFLLGERLT